MPKTFAEVYDLYRNLSKGGAIPDSMPLNKFATFANDMTSSEDFSSGTGGWFGQQVSKGSYWLDKGIEATGAPDIAGSLGRKAFEMFSGSGDQGEQVGRSVPRGFADFAPLMVAGALAPESGGASLLPWLTPAVATGSTAALMAGHTFADTQSVGRAGLSAAMLPIMGKGGELAQELMVGSGLLKPTAVSTVVNAINEEPVGQLATQKVLEGFGQKAMNFVGHQVGAIGAAEATNYAADAIANKTWNPYEGQSIKDRLLGATLGNVPYMLSGIKGVFDRSTPTVGRPEYSEIKPPAGTEPAPSVDVSNVDSSAAATMAEKIRHRVKQSVIRQIKDPEKRQQAKDELDQMIGLGHYDMSKFDESQKDAYWNYDDMPEDVKPLASLVYGLPEDKTWYHVHDVNPDRTLGEIVHSTDSEAEAKDVQKRHMLSGKSAALRVETPEDRLLAALDKTLKSSVDDIKTPADLAKHAVKEQVLKEVTGAPAKNEVPKVTDVVSQLGANPVEALKAAQVGATNEAHVDASGEVMRRRRMEQKSAEELVAQSTAAEELKKAHADPNASKAIPQSLRDVLGLDKPRAASPGEELAGASGKKYRLTDKPRTGNPEWSTPEGEERFGILAEEGRKLMENQHGLDYKRAYATWTRWLREVRGLDKSRGGWETHPSFPANAISALKSKLALQAGRALAQKSSVVTPKPPKVKSQVGPDAEIADMAGSDIVMLVGKEMGLDQEEAASLQIAVDSHGLEEGIRRYLGAQRKAKQEAVWQTIRELERDPEWQKRMKVWDEERPMTAVEKIRLFSDRPDYQIPEAEWTDKPLYVWPEAYSFGGRPLKDGKMSKDLFYDVMKRVAGADEVMFIRNIIAPEAFNENYVDVNALLDSVDKFANNQPSGRPRKAWSVDIQTENRWMETYGHGETNYAKAVDPKFVFDADKRKIGTTTESSLSEKEAHEIYQNALKGDNGKDPVPTYSGQADYKDLIQAWRDRNPESVGILEYRIPELVGSSGSRYVLKTPAGGGFAFKLQKLVREINGKLALTGRKTLAADGTLDKAAFFAAVSRQVDMDEIKLWRMLAPEVLDKPRINVLELAKVLEERMPTVEVKKLGDRVTDRGSVARRAQHELETRGFTVDGSIGEGFSVSDRDGELVYDAADPVVQRLLNDLNSEVENEGNTPDAQYSFLGPKAERDMPGYVEGLVRVPTKPNSYNEAHADFTEAGFKKKIQEGGVKFTGPHFGEHDTNVLAFFRGYEETLPGGKKAFHVIEVQSDWGQALRDTKKEAERHPDLDVQYRNVPDEVKEGQDINHPLLSVYESLALKAAIQHAREIGADRIVLSDGETAMMTEGHDKAATSLIVLKATDASKAFIDNFYEEQDAWKKYINPDGTLRLLDAARENLAIIKQELGDDVIGYGMEVSQSGGMRLHYDRTLPDKLAKLTGDKGSVVELGTHVKAAPLAGMDANRDILDQVGNGMTQQEAMRALEARGVREPVVGSPIFRDYRGRPKTQISGRAYDISHFEKDHEFDLFGAKGRGEVSPESGSSSEPMADSSPVKVPAARETFGKVLRKTGFSDSEIKTWSDFMADIQHLFGLDDVGIGELINDVKGNPIAGMANLGKMRQMFIAAGLEGPSKQAGLMLGMTLGHESGHIISKMAERGQIPSRFAERIHDFKEFLATKPEQAKEFLGLMRETLRKEFRDLPVWDEWLKNTDSEEMYANTMAMWAASRISGEEGRAFALVAAPEGRSFLQSLTEYARRVWGALKSTFGLKPKLASEHFKGGLDGLLKTFDDLTKSMRESENAMADLQTFASMGSSDIWTLRTSQLVESENTAKAGDQTFGLAKRKETDRSVQSKLESGWNYAFRTMHDLAMSIPSLRQAVSKAMEQGPMQMRLANNAIAPLFGGMNPDTGTITMHGAEAQFTKKILSRSNEKLSRLFDDIGQWMQREEYPGGMPTEAMLKEHTPMWPPGAKNATSLYERFMSLKPDDRRGLLNSFQLTSLMHAKIAEQTVAAFQENGRSVMMLFGGQKVPGMWKDMPKYVQQLTDAFDRATSGDPQKELVGQKELEVLRVKLNDDETFNQMMQDWSDSKSDSAQLQQHFDEHPEHMSLIRVGEWKVSAFNEDGDQYTDALPDRESYEKWKEGAKAAGYTKFTMPEKVERGTHVALNDSAINLIAELDQKRMDNIKNSPTLSDEVKKLLMQDEGVSGQLARLLNARDVSIPGFKKGIRGGSRRVIPGSMNMLETQRIYASLAAKLNTNRVTKTRMVYELTNPELAKYPAEVAQMKQQMMNYQTPDSPFSRALTKFNAQFFLAGNIPTQMLNLMQSFHTLVPEAVRHTGSYIGSMTKTLGAVKDVGKFTLELMKEKVGLDKDHLAVSRMADPEEQALFRWNIDKGYWSFGHLGDLTDHDMDAATDLNKLAQTGKTDKMSKQVLRPVKMLGDMTMKMFAATEHFNQRVATLTGFRIAREKMGKDYNREAAFEFARDFMRSTTYAGGKINRPMAQGDLKTVGNLAYSLQGYTVGWLNQVTRYFRHWKGSEYLNLSPGERDNARKAATAQLGIMVGSAGVLGLPFVGAMLRTLEKATGTSITGNLQAGLAQMLDDDAKDGYGLSSVILSGAANAMLAQSGLPVDMGSRWAMNGAFGLNPYDGFNGDATFGPTGQVVASAVAGFKSAVGGDLIDAAAQVAPNALKKAIKLWKNDGQIETSAGQPLDTTNFDKAAYALGFTPQSVSRINQFEQYKKATDESVAIMNKRDAAEVLGFLRDDPIAARQKISQMALTSNESSQQIATRVARTAAEQAFPKDIRRETTARTAEHLSEIARSLGVSIPEANEVARSQYMQQVMMQLGARPMQVSRSAVQHDALDQEFSPFIRRR